MNTVDRIREFGETGLYRSDIHPKVAFDIILALCDVVEATVDPPLFELRKKVNDLLGEEE